ncbi:MAG: pyridoxamine 5-phosphate oxidase [Gaiellales bacterium]|jgi:pyridoxamine 5'-phosphate oxidase|nr:pyridoxamine 5-phosphate oxidase [Gaiellales bacterium]
MDAADPIAVFREWHQAAQSARIGEPEAMSLATADGSGRPSSRMVLLRGLDDRGFRFFTNRTSRKGRDLTEHPRAALLFHWQPLGRQVRIEGPVSVLSDEESDAYFETRERMSQLAAWASDQSRPIASREELLERLAAAERQFEGRPVERPSHWGGYVVAPESIEFWEHGDHRLHHRRRFSRNSDGGWTSELLAP